MRTCAQYKDLSLATLENKWGIAVLAFVVICVVEIVVNLIATQLGQGFGGQGGASFFSCVFQILLLPLELGWAYVTLKLARYNTPKVEDVFVGFKDYKRIFLTLLRKAIYIFLWSLLLIVPGIVKSYSYAMTEYLLIDNPQLKYDAAITASSQLMKGKKWDLFVLDLSFIGWAILCLVTCGIGFIFLAPYWRTARAHFYEDLRAGSEVTVTYA